ncbi:hypothetical protein LTS10_012181 [Elasticomyces elasticus]|nr:hypothetical protein LTS10_012181 [Elasticomyces elasticus]
MLPMNSLAVLAASSLAVSAYKPCPLLGPVFEAPDSLCEATIFQSALKNLTATLDYAGRSGVTPFGKIPSEATSFTVGIFDAESTLFSHQYSSAALKNGTAGVKTVTEDSVFRIGSGSKLITVYLFLVEVGAQYWSHPITDFLPILAEAAQNCSATGNPVDCIDWEHVTLGSLASHVSGIPRDYAALFDLLTRLPAGTSPTAFGFPQLPASDYPTCGYNFTNFCGEDAYLRGYASEAPLFAPYTTPVYSNGAFALLGLALENITGRPFEDMLQTDLFDKLGMVHSSYSLPNDTSDAVMPLGSVNSGFVANIGLEGPVGGYYSSQSDLIKMAQSIMDSKLLTPSETRQWMKPVTHTSNLRMSVGMPWEIWRSTDLASHEVEIYTKSGDVFSYSSMTVIIPDYNVGFVVLAAGNSTTSTVEKITDLVVATIIPALEATAREQTRQSYAGTYTSADASLASNITLVTRPNEPGLIVDSWYSNGTDFLSIISAAVYGSDAGVDIRLYPTNLVQQGSNATARVQYRAVIETLDTAPDGGLFSPNCQTWAMTAIFSYGFVGLEDFLFEVVGGKVVSLSPRALRTTLAKTT